MDREKRQFDVDPGVEALIRLEEHQDSCAEFRAEVREYFKLVSARLWWILGTAIIGACAIAFEIFKQNT